eukprot:TRINITY_DN5086_c0_g3_i1.p1 TRINITY_DN5086_c0_g3~~TRINITY_DN5086_c0_g3_i1.p1  ORF type:complete len:313 (+),score=55.70 TRINITY_DN5086_c0_g3_i1:190-1128(+)
MNMTRILFTIFTISYLIAAMAIFRKFQFTVWKIQLVLLRRFPRLPPLLLKVAYHLVLLVLVAVIPLNFICFFHFYPYRNSFSYPKAICLTLFFIRCYITYVQNVYTESLQWHIETVSLTLRRINFGLFILFQVIICCWVLGNGSGNYACVFLSLNFYLTCSFAFFMEPKGTISFDGFCAELVEHLERTHESRKKLTVPLFTEQESKMPSIPDERPEENAAGKNSVEIEIPPLNFSFFNIPPIHEAKDLSNSDKCFIGEQRDLPSKEESFVDLPGDQQRLSEILEKNIKTNSALWCKLGIYTLTLALYTIICA